MFRRLALLAFATLLSACVGNPVNQDFDTSRDFAAYRSWSWKEPALQYRPDDPRIKSDLTEQRIRQAIADQLDQRGLRPAPAGTRGDVQVQTYMIVEDRQQQLVTTYGSGWGGPWRGYWDEPVYSQVRNVSYKVATVQIDLLDGKDGKLVWRGSDERMLSYSPSPTDRSTAVHETVSRILANYPPR